MNRLNSLHSLVSRITAFSRGALAAARIAPWLVCVCGLAAGSGCNVTSHAQNAQGVRLFQQANYPAAVQRFQSAVYNDPRNADAYYNLGATYHRLGNMQQRNDYLDQAEMYYQQCLERDLNHRDAHRGLAVLLVEAERSEDAFALVEDWTTRSPNRADARIELARLYDEFGDVETAKQKLLEALSVEPSNARALAALGKIREEQGDYNQALVDYQRSLTANRFQPEVAARLNTLYQAANRGASAPIVANPRGTSPARAQDVR